MKDGLWCLKVLEEKTLYLYLIDIESECSSISNIPLNIRSFRIKAPESLSYDPGGPQELVPYTTALLALA